ncbi:DUF4998 domain-containing protein [Mucilaginibacter flavus]|uniref:DUF4998 domain-containing protein n=1 Tax=Mucilaginibacter flavus TaxID=931504 RepID=UPI0025B532FB|nr:DUF4998 domain-containing protein [Mucilaginibacter flavus]MDN3580856.1 DUF4998 domain-containing protein [Mucilaginibacter flavus]
MKITFNIAVCFLIGLALSGCKKYDTDYKSYLANHEVTYPGLATGVTYHAGNLRAVLVWHPSPDPSIKSYVVTWNNGSDSVVVAATSHSPADSITVSIPNLKEYVYSFTIVAHDGDGNKSVGQDLNNVRVYGATYISGLANRAYNQANPYQFNADGSLTLNFAPADTGNVSTTIKYTNKLGASATAQLAAKSSSVTLTDYKLGTDVKYQSYYIPEKGSVDLFSTGTDDNFAKIIHVVLCDKSLFKEYRLPTDIESAYGWYLPYMWDGKTDESQGPGFYANYHDFPTWVTIDMGQQASLYSMKIWQRTSGLYDQGNPKRFEIWGSNNPSANGDFSTWVKLSTFNSVKPSGLPRGQNSQADKDFAAAGESFTFPAGLQQYRYIRISMLETWGESNYWHMMEISMYKVDNGN